MPHKNKTRERVIKEAGKLFARKGYEATSMSEIAAKVGIEKASLYYFFKDKDELFGTVTEQIWSPLASELRSPKFQNEKITEKLFIHYITEVINTNLKAGLLVLKFDVATGSTHGKKAHDHVEYMKMRLREFLSSRKIKDVKAAETLIVSAIQGYVIQAQVRKSEIKPEQFGTYLANLIFNK